MSRSNCQKTDGKYRTAGEGPHDLRPLPGRDAGSAGALSGAFRKCLFLLLTAAFLAGCNKEKPAGPDQAPDSDAMSRFYYDDSSYQGVALERKTIGEVRFPSGGIIAADPFYIAEDFTFPFARRIVPGRYPVSLCYADIKDWGRRVAFARIDFSAERPSEWVGAALAGGDPSESAYGVDAGLGTFVDESLKDAFADEIANFDNQKPGGNFYVEVLEKEFHDDGSWAIHDIANSDGQIVIFESGLGDGAYESYWGMKDGRVISLVTDFGIFSDD